MILHSEDLMLLHKNHLSLSRYYAINCLTDNCLSKIIVWKMIFYPIRPSGYCYHWSPSHHRNTAETPSGHQRGIISTSSINNRKMTSWRCGIGCTPIKLNLKYKKHVIFKIGSIYSHNENKSINSNHFNKIYRCFSGLGTRVICIWQQTIYGTPLDLEV